VEIATTARVIFAGTVKTVKPFQYGNSGNTMRVTFQDVRVVGLAESTKEISLAVAQAQSSRSTPPRTVVDPAPAPPTFEPGARYFVFADSLLEDPAYCLRVWDGAYQGVFRVDLSPDDSARLVRDLYGLPLEHIGREYIDSTAARLAEERLLEMRHALDDAAGATVGTPRDKTARRAAVDPRGAFITESAFLKLVAEWRKELAQKSPTVH
jgi:hypothetical protein